MARRWGAAKTLREIWEEPIDALCINIEKLVKCDTGGTKGEIPDSTMKLYEKARRVEIKHNDPRAGAIILHRYHNRRMRATRLAIMARTTVLRCKNAGMTFAQCVALFKKKARRTQSGATKRRIRAYICGEQGY